MGRKCRSHSTERAFLCYTSELQWYIPQLFIRKVQRVRKQRIDTPPFSDIYGHTAKDDAPFLKSRFYESDHGLSGIAAERDPARHAEIRKIASQGFSAKALRDQETVLHRNADMLISQLRASNGFGGSINIRDVGALSSSNLSFRRTANDSVV